MPYTFSQCLDEGCQATVDDIGAVVTASPSSSSAAIDAVRGIRGVLSAGTRVWTGSGRQHSLNEDAQIYTTAPIFKTDPARGLAQIGMKGGPAKLESTVSATRVVETGPTPPADGLPSGSSIYLLGSTVIRLGELTPEFANEAERAAKGSFPSLPTTDTSYEGMTAAYAGWNWVAQGMSAVAEIPYKAGRSGRLLRVAGRGEYAIVSSNPAAFGGLDRIIVPVITVASFSGRVRDTPAGMAPIARFADGSALFVPVRRRS